MLQLLQDKGASVELAELLVSLADAVRGISASIVRTDTGYTGTHNAFGEAQIAMDVAAEEIIQNHLKACPFVASFCSEELDAIQDGHADGLYSVFYDPLDGSSLVNVNFSIGTIVGIYEGADVMGRTPREQVAALYAIYGPRTTLVLTTGQGVMEFTLMDGEWEVTEEALTIDGKKKYFAPGNLRACKDREDYYRLVQDFIQDQYTLRYSGGMVPDINHILKKGSGVFMYPGMPSAPDGKLRLLYECGPMAMLMEQAGGASSNGSVSILDLEIKELVQRTPIFVGQASDVQRAVEGLEMLDDIIQSEREIAAGETVSLDDL